MAFVDEVRIEATAGSGGNGVTAFRREPFTPKGGPDGGDGGAGASVILRADHSVGTLLDLRDHPHVKADRGGHGEGSKRAGAAGTDRIVLVPVGTVVFDEDDVLVADLAGPGQEFVAARGGRGGRGNARFATATRRAPAYSEKGEPGEVRKLRLELRLLADIGLVGFPNAGKSTLISRISAAKPKIADYPFTTLVPNLGVVERASMSFVVADIPGLVPGAHEGKGLGDRFLRHIRRAAVLVYLVDLAAIDRDPAEDVAVLRTELVAFDEQLAARPFLVVASKVDAAREVLDRVREAEPEVIPISAVTGAGIPELLDRFEEEVARARAAAPVAEGYVRHVVREQAIAVSREDNAWRVDGTRPIRAVSMTNLESDEGVQRLQKRLIAMGVEKALLDAGASKGDEVRIGVVSFEFVPEPDVAS